MENWAESRQKPSLCAGPTKTEINTQITAKL